MSPKSNHLNYLNFFHEAVADCTPAVADDPEWSAQEYIDNHRIHPDKLKPVSDGAKYRLKMEAEGRRYCQKCGHWRPAEYFARYENRYAVYCKGCMKDYDKERRLIRSKAKSISKLTK